MAETFCYDISGLGIMNTDGELVEELIVEAETRRIADIIAALVKMDAEEFSKAVDNPR